MTLGEFVTTYFGEMLSFFLLTLLTQNMIFSRALGASTSLWVVRKKYGLFWFGLIMTLITVLASIGAYFVLPYLQDSDWYYYLSPLVYVAIIAVVYIIMLLVAQRLPLKSKKMILLFIHRSAFNCTVLGALLLLGTEYSSLSLAGFIGFAAGCGVGFTLATYMISIAYERLGSEDIPKAFRGFPVTLFYIGILSLAIYGMIGHELPV